MMELEALLQPEVQAFIQAHEREDLGQISLKKSLFPGIPMSVLVQQMAGRQVAQKKFPSLYPFPLLYPPKINLEQTSSEATAKYKASLVEGSSFCDLTAGFGIDSFFLSQNFEHTTLVEQNHELLQLVQHNWQALNQKADFVSGNLHDFLARNRDYFDLIYLDPARRDASKKKVFLLEDLSPNILQLNEVLRKKAQMVMVKLSPLIDLHYLGSVLPTLQAIHVVAVRNEVKEVLVLLGKDGNLKPLIFAVNIETNEPTFSSMLNDRFTTEPQYSKSQKFLYIPNAAILKAGLTNSLAKNMGLSKLHPNTQLLTGAEEIPDFPGRVLKVESVDKSFLTKGLQANVLSKNYPLSPDLLKKKYKIKDGGKDFLIFCRSMQGLEILRSL